MACFIEAIIGCFVLFSCGTEICRASSTHEKRENYSKSKYSYNKECTICLEKIDKNYIIKRLNCGHVYHRRCYEDWMNTQTVIFCPNCGN